MQCPGADSVFVRANGNFVCWDDSGSDKILQRYKSENDTSKILSSNGYCSFIAKKLSSGAIPFPETCPGCSCLSLLNSPCYNKRILNVMQVEPSSLCTLQCRACATPEDRERLQPPNNLSPTVFRKILQDFSRGRIDIRTFDFSGHGEPLMNPELWELISIARLYYPDAFISLITNAQGFFKEEHASSGLDQIQFSIDGTNQQCYEKYRVGGDFDKAYSYMKSFCQSTRYAESPVRTVWRYILFDHNDQPDQIVSACRMTDESGINELRFIFTHCGMWSTKLTSAKKLRGYLLKLGIPSRKIKLHSFKNLRKRQKLGQILKLNHGLFCIARKCWRKVKRNISSEMIITSDFYQLNEVELLKALELGHKYLRKGNVSNAEALFLHVNKLIQSPSAHNHDYDPQLMAKSLGPMYIELRHALNKKIAAIDM